MKRVIVFIIIILVSVSPLVRGLFFDVEFSIFLAAIALLSFCYTIYKLVKKERFQTHKSILLLGSLLIVAYIISFKNAVNIRENIEIILKYLEYLIVFTVLYDYFIERHQKFFYYLVPPMTITGFAVAIIGLLPMPASLNLLNGLVYNDRIGSSFQYTNTASMYYALSFILILTLVSITEKPVINILFSGLGAVLFIALLYSKSLGGIIIGFVGLLFLYILQPKGHKIKTLISLLIMSFAAIVCYGPYSNAFVLGDYFTAGIWILYSFLGAAACAAVYYLLRSLRFNKVVKYVSYVIGFFVLAGAIYIFAAYGNITQKVVSIDVISELSRVDTNIASVTSRVEFFKDSFKLISENWLLGLGGGGWKSLYQSVQENYYIAHVVHNQYLQTFVEAGILGFVSFTLIIILPIINFIKGYLSNKDSVNRVFIAGFTVGFTALAIHATIDFDLSYTSMQLILWLLILASAIIPGKQKIENNTDIKKRRRPPLFTPVVLLLCIGLFLIRSIDFAAAYNADKGLRLMDKGDYSESIKYYEKAYSIDSINSDYASQLAVMYDHFAIISSSFDEFQSWSRKAIELAQRSTELNRYFPAYQEILTRAYLDSGKPAEALASAEKLVKYQPCNPGNYEILARSYMEAATYYRSFNDDKNAAEAIIKCSEIDNNFYVIKTPGIEYYKGKALIVLSEYEEAEKCLLEAKTSEDYRLFSEVLLYIISELTGKTAQKSSEYADLSLKDIKSSALYQEMGVLLGQ